jgi:hypothetical protein
MEYVLIKNITIMKQVSPSNMIVGNKESLIVRGIKSPRKVVKYLLQYFFYKLLPDELYIKLLYWACMGKRLDLNNPKTYSEKLQWLKLYYRKPEFTLMVDKYQVKKIVAEKVGKDFVIPTIGVWDSPSEIDWDSLPNQFVLKTTHGGGGSGVAICKDKSQFDKLKAIELLSKSMTQDIYKLSREWPYKNIAKKVIAEKYISESNGGLKDYKFFCFDGVVKFMFIATSRFDKKIGTRFDFFDENFNHLPFEQGHPNADYDIPKPQCFEQMKEIASKLSEGLPHLRVDLYEVDGHIYFGENTFYHFSGLVPFMPEEWDYKFGEMLHLEKVSKCE